MENKLTPALSKKVAGHPCQTQEEYDHLDKTTKRIGCPPVRPGKDMPDQSWRSLAWFSVQIIGESAEVREFPMLDEAWQQWAFDQLADKDLTRDQMLKQMRQMINSKVKKEEANMARGERFQN